MKVELDGAALHAALGAAIYDRSSPLVVLGSALIDADGKRVRVTTSDMEAFFSAELEAKVSQSGRICVNVDLLRAAAREGTLGLSHNADSSIVQASPHGGSRLRLQATPADAFPIPDEAEWQAIALDPIVFGEALNLVGYAAGKTDANAHLNAVAFGPGLFCATNRHRGALFHTDYAGPAFIVPIKKAAALLPLAQVGARIELAVRDGSARMLRIAHDGCEIVVRLISAVYPNIRSFVDGAGDTRAIFNREKLLKAARQFMPFTKRDGIKAGRALENAAWLVAKDGAAHFEAGENIENCSWALGDLTGEIRLSLSLVYLAEALATIDADKVRITLCEGSMPRLLIEPVTAGGDAPHQHVIAEMRI